MSSRTLWRALCSYDRVLPLSLGSSPPHRRFPSPAQPLRSHPFRSRATSFCAAPCFGTLRCSLRATKQAFLSLPSLSRSRSHLRSRTRSRIRSRSARKSLLAPRLQRTFPRCPLVQHNTLALSDGLGHLRKLQHSTRSRKQGVSLCSALCLRRGRGRSACRAPLPVVLSVAKGRSLRALRPSLLSSTPSCNISPRSFAAHSQASRSNS
jgi:hypothetical protein